MRLRNVSKRYGGTHTNKIPNQSQFDFKPNQTLEMEGTN